MMPNFKRFMILTLTFFMFNSSLRSEQPDQIIDIWPSAIPGEKMEVGPEEDVTKDTDKLIAGRRIIKLANVKTPQAHVFLPPENLRTGASVVICPGGGFSILAWDLEGVEIAQWLNTLGVAGIVLKYRVPTRDHNPRWKAAAQDAQRTISLVRHRSKAWKLDPKKVGALGFSAGGMATAKATLAKTRYYESVDEADGLSYRPDRVMLIYAAGLPGSGDRYEDGKDEVTAETPPAFIIHAFDDFVPASGAANMFLALKKANVASELHIFDKGGHGYGLRKRDDHPVTKWPALCEEWLRGAGWVH